MILVPLKRGLCLSMWLVVLVVSAGCSGRAATKIESVPTSGVYAEQWKAWKLGAGKSYESSGEEAQRYTIWKGNQDYIDQHNTETDKHGYTLKMNSFGDMVGGPGGRHNIARVAMRNSSRKVLK